jgi:Flp pilus assembly pilin Flp
MNIRRGTSRDEGGTTTTEYGMLIAFGVISIYGATQLFMAALSLFYGSMQGTATSWG